MDIQKAGDNSKQIQVHNINVINGVDEKRAREIFDEKYCLAKKDFTAEALRVANYRVKELEDKLIPKIEAIDGGLKAFADPSFQLLLVEAQKSAAATERPVDYDLLSELLVHRIEKGFDRHIRTGIHRAIDIIEDISDEALLGLTIVHSLSTFTPSTGNILEGLDVLNNMFGKIIYSHLPKGYQWIEHLDILDAIRINQYGKFNPIEDIYTKGLSGYTKIGIRKNSENHKKAIAILESNCLSSSNLIVEHALNNGYVRLNLCNELSLNYMLLSVNIGSQVINIPLSTQQKEAMTSLYTLYDNDEVIANQVVTEFIKQWDLRENLRKLKEWWREIPKSFSITSIGRVLAHANAQRCDSNLPPLN
jgi:hypothetical protein